MADVVHDPAREWMLEARSEYVRVLAILDPRTPPAAVRSLAERPGNGARVRAALALSPALLPEERTQIIREEQARARPEDALKRAPFRIMLAEYVEEQDATPRLTPDERAAVDDARAALRHWKVGPYYGKTRPPLPEPPMDPVPMLIVIAAVVGGGAVIWLAPRFPEWLVWAFG